MENLTSHMIHTLNRYYINIGDELTLQLHREYFKAHDLYQDSFILMGQPEKQSLFQLQPTPHDDQRRLSFLIHK